MKYYGFTLAEILITLAIIGVVAVLTIPNLIQSHNEKAWSTAQDVFTKRLEVATRQMNTEEKLAGYANTKDFVNELKKYIKITRVCDNNELTKCFEDKILTEDPKEIDITTLSTSENFAKDNWGTETIGVQFANGVNALIAYNPNTDQQPFNSQFSATEASMAILYDVSGYKNPNTIGKDINQNANVKKLGCMIKKDLVGGICISNILAPDTGYSPLTYAQCNESKANNEIDLSYCYPGNDYLAGAVKACGGKKANLPNQAQLIEIAKYIYPNASSISSSEMTNASWEQNRIPLFTSQSPNASSFFFIWSQEAGQTFGTIRVFTPTYTTLSTNMRNSSGQLAVCIDQ